MQPPLETVMVDTAARLLFTGGGSRRIAIGKGGTRPADQKRARRL